MQRHMQQGLESRQLSSQPIPARPPQRAPDEGALAANLAGGWLTTITVGRHRTDPATLAARLAKRALDIGVATVLLLVAAPVFIAVALAVKASSPGPVFYRARRVGRGGRPLGVLKFRKMRDDASGFPLTLGADDRFTRIGSFLSATRIDELPQLWQVLTGKMSLVGPRPEAQQFVDVHPEPFRTILTVRPGVSGWTQLCFIDEKQIIGDADPVRSYVDQLLPRKVELDVLYASSRTVADDVKLLCWTPLVMLLHFGVVFDPGPGRFRLVRRRANATSEVPLVATGTTAARVPAPREPSPPERT